MLSNELELTRFEHLPFGLEALFIATALLTFFFIYKSLANTKKRVFATSVATVFLWILLQGILSSAGVYIDALDQLPPKIFILGLAPTIVLSIFLLFTSKGKKITSNLSTLYLISLSIVRIPVELGLHWLYTEGAIPQAMTYSGWNFDIIMGLTAPIMAILYKQNKLNTQGGKLAFKAWNIIGIILLLTIIVTSIISAPFPFQQIAFNQPNLAILYFPYALLATFIAPFTLLTHFLLLKNINTNQ